MITEHGPEHDLKLLLEVLGWNSSLTWYFPQSPLAFLGLQDCLRRIEQSGSALCVSRDSVRALLLAAWLISLESLVGRLDSFGFFAATLCVFYGLVYFVCLVFFQCCSGKSLLYILVYGCWFCIFCLLLPVTYSHAQSWSLGFGSMPAVHICVLNRLALRIVWMGIIS